MLWSFARSLTFVPLGTIQRRRGMHERSGRGTLTRSRIIRAAADLFHQKGARATSPDEIIAASRTGKGQFYHYFRNKEGLVHEVLQTYLEAIKSGTSPIDYEISSWRDLERWFAAHLELQKRYQMTRGCPFGTLGNEVSADDELVRQDVSLIFEVVRNKLTSWRTRDRKSTRLNSSHVEISYAVFCLKKKKKKKKYEYHSELYKKKTQ